ncbi:hypothetical protein IAI10_16320 [Clostridium sp. 19966]|uniref:hypothetical protein n=1 Tax=Clostridium sp. 19966 TaxID=2768166 RepID=UPI0028DDEF1C|nr:hypothetical protein [Clostridium sp. 19966]MDT8718233.1 hypothetical protein [Clostridium sp. 19966]
MRQISLIAIVLFMILFFPLNIDMTAMTNAEDLKYDYSEAVDNATSDAANALLMDNNDELMELQANGGAALYSSLNLDEGLKRFQRSLYLNLRIEENYAAQQALQNKIPIIIAAGYDGYYIHSWMEQKIKGSVKYTNDWTNKKLYEILDTKLNIKIRFTMDNYVYIQDLSSGQKYEGDKSKFESKYPNYFGEKFEKIRSQVINQVIQRDLQYYTYNSNKVAKLNGWQLAFNIPYWGNRSITSVSFIAFLQGEISRGVSNYNTYGFGTAKIYQRKPIYGYEMNGKKYYSNNMTGDNITSFFDEYEAAQNGYFPDPKYYK